jgi:putative ABC transport system permease protein
MNFASLELGPLFRAAGRKKFTSILVILQIAITMAIITNTIHILFERYQWVHRDSGLDEENSFYFSSAGFSPDFNPLTTITEDLAHIRATPGVIDALATKSFPLLNGGNWENLQTQPGEQYASVPTAVYKVDEHALRTFNLSLLAGDNFRADEVIWQQESDNSWPSQVILSKATAINLSSEQNWAQLVGKTIYVDLNKPLIVKGIVDKLQAPWIEWPQVENTMLVPANVMHSAARYLVRTEKGYLNELMEDIPQQLAKNNRHRAILSLQSIKQAKQAIYGSDYALISLLLSITIVLTAVTAMGIAGLASFNVNKRSRQIGTRRALGASRLQIVRHFMLENLLLGTFGVMFGALLTLGLNMQLVNWYNLPALHWLYIPIGMVILLLVGQLAVLWPASKASRLSPALATRSN